MNFEYGFCDYPTAWEIQRQGLIHVDDACSAVQTKGAMLCDCPALMDRWHELKSDYDARLKEDV